MTDIRVRDLMTRGVFCVGPRDTVERAYDLMNERGLRHLLVVDGDGDLVGLVSHRDLLRNALIERGAMPLNLERALMRRIRVEEVMTSEVETADPEQSVAAAAQVMLENKFGCLPVVEGMHLVGILTESDFVRHFAGDSRQARSERRGPRANRWWPRAVAGRSA
jgi:CBS domain-containing membrane protein